MGVTLERVQFKFASIIGELCSEPDVLSQFAVWVDLRLAEYKLKGSISLDCSGDTPDPVWLKGILSALLAKRLETQKLKAAAQIHRIPTPTRTNVRKTPQNSSYSRHVEERQIVTLSPEPVIKQEPSEDDLFPVSLHVNETETLGNGGTKSDVRKRSATDFSSSPSHKDRRLDTRTTLDVEPSNESLISIIGGEDLTDDPSNSSSFANNSSIDYNIAAEIAENAQKQINAAMDQSTDYISNSGEIIPSAGTSDSTASHSGWSVQNFPTGVTNAYQQHLHGQSQPTGKGVHTPYQPHLRGQSNHTKNVNSPQRLQGISHSAGKEAHYPHQSPGQSHSSGFHKSDRSRIKAFDTWLRSKVINDHRGMANIPPRELTIYLANYFTNVKTKSGTDFSRNSLIAQRTSIERYLRSEGYPFSITCSSVFKQSQIAFREKLKSVSSSATAIDTHLPDIHQPDTHLPETHQPQRQLDSPQKQHTETQLHGLQTENTGHFGTPQTQLHEAQRDTAQTSEGPLGASQTQPPEAHLVASQTQPSVGPLGGSQTQPISLPALPAAESEPLSVHTELDGMDYDPSELLG